jgi:DmsE family decaheme c-type cytochrome
MPPVRSPKAAEPLVRALLPGAGFLLAAIAALAASPGRGAAAAPPPQEEPLSCADCHDEAAAAMPGTLHAKVAAEPALEGCATCHRGAKRHLAVVQGEVEGKPPHSGFDGPVDCLLCHSGIPEKHGKEMPAFAEHRGKSCATCHRAHAPAKEWKALRALGPFPDAKALAAAGAKDAGADACAKCHDAPVKGFRGSPHAAALAAKGAAACEACHGPASLHAASGGSRRLVLGAGFGALDAAAQARLCLGCHATDAPDHARDFAKSEHSRGGKTCASCHHVHAPPVPAPAAGFSSLEEALRGAKPVGSARCADCHADPHPGLAKSRHAPVMAKGAGCEGCHGPGSVHADTGGKAAFILGPARLATRERDAICLSCHGATATPAAWNRQAHGAAGVSCAECHDAFAPPGEAARKPEMKLCAECHGAEVAQFRLPSRHPVPEGSLRCSDCHDLHRGSPAVFAGKRWTDTCASCHRVEGAPRLHPHEADRADGCVACHAPHGSTAPRLLRFARVVDLCLSCHVPPATHDLSAGAGFRDCLACHTEIHGSDADRKLLR